MQKQHDRVWTWDLPASPSALWPYLSDTARFNEAAGTPRYTVTEEPQPDGSVRRRANASYKGVAVEWDDPPYEWAFERDFRQTRVFRRGPLKSLGLVVKLDASPTGGSRVTYRVSGTPRGLVGHLLFATGLLDKMGKGLGDMVDQAGRFAAGQAEVLFDYTPPELTPEQRARLDGLTRQISVGSYHHGLAERLASHITMAQEVDLVRIRPRKLARDWQAPVRHVAELCLDAARLGLLGLSWNLLCPRCGGAKASADTLEALPKQAHCPSCNIAYDGSFTSNIEISFRPATAIRSIGEGEFCMGGPHVSRHILVQQILAPGEERSVAATLPAGEYRLRTLEPGGECIIRHDDGAFPILLAENAEAPAFTMRAEPGGSASNAIGTIAMRNHSSRELTFVIESRAWRSDALTAHEVTTLQAFRDLMPDQVLRAGEDVGIDSITLMFTDLEGSTALYERLGDAAAYRLVRRHFGVLAETIREHDGALIKTIGDAVMAAFATPEQAMHAALHIHDRIAAFNADYSRETGSADTAIGLKMGLHGGRCIAVTLNERLDYFGSTVNLTARLQGRSRRGEIVLSESLAADPAIAPLLRDRVTSRESAELKGFDKPMFFVRLTA